MIQLGYGISDVLLISLRTGMLSEAWRAYTYHFVSIRGTALSSYDEVDGLNSSDGMLRVVDVVRQFAPNGIPIVSFESGAIHLNCSWSRHER